MPHSTLLSRLADADSVLLAGAGGGFDVFSALPLYFALRDAGKQVHLANLTFTYLGATAATHLGCGVFRVDRDTPGPTDYFPERHLAEWLAELDDEQPVWCLQRQGVLGLTSAYARLAQRLDFDAVVLVDGGTDSLMRGDEAGLGTPAGDISSVLAADALAVERKFLVCLGFGVDRYHGVCHAQFLEAVAELSRAGAYLGAWSLTPDMPDVQRYLECVEYVQERTPGRESIVCASITSAIEGHYGDHHRLPRTRNTGSTLWINPLMSLYWAFDLPTVADRVIYRDLVSDTQTFGELCARIGAFRKGVAVRPWEDIPV
jgi:hypothetical protein